MTVKKVNVRIIRNKGIIICPICNRHEEIAAKEGGIKKVCFYCKTKLIINFYSDKRKFFRKKTCISGTAIGKTTYANIEIQDLSCVGASFCVREKGMGFYRGDRILMKFFLPDKKQTEIEVEGLVLRADINQTYSVEFIGVNNYSKEMKAIGFWLR